MERVMKRVISISRLSLNLGTTKKMREVMKTKSQAMFTKEPID
jgi:hypothetical protein